MRVSNATSPPRTHPKEGATRAWVKRGNTSGSYLVDAITHADRVRLKTNWSKWQAVSLCCAQKFTKAAEGAQILPFCVSMHASRVLPTAAWGLLVVVVWETERVNTAKSEKVVFIFFLCKMSQSSLLIKLRKAFMKIDVQFEKPSHNNVIVAFQYYYAWRTPGLYAWL